jgi:ABC-2 type transport system permease protein
MAVYKQTYAPYEGPQSAERWRFAILTRYAFRSVFETRLLPAYFFLCFIPPLLACGVVYANHNLKAIEGLAMGPAGGFLSSITLNDAFFRFVFRTQAFLSFLLVTFVGPGLVSADMANSALVVYLSKPLSRAEYVWGRLTILLVLSFTMTLLPAAVMFAVQTDLAGWSWLSQNYRMPVAFAVSYALWVFLISLLALAVSASFKWRPMATGVLLVLFFAGAGLGSLMNAMLQLNMQWGLLLNLDASVSMILDWLMTGVNARGNVPAWAAVVWLMAICLVCVESLRRKIRPDGS